MRLIIYFLLSLVLTLPLSSQEYTPIIINGEVFFKTQILTDEGILPAEITVTNLITIDDVFYVRTFLKRNFEPDMLVGYLREDPGTSELYFRGLGSTTEQLIYTMNLEVGDQVEWPARWCDGGSGDLAIVTSIQTVDGRKQITFDRQVGANGLCEPLQFIEGVGPTATVLYAYLRNQPIQNGAAKRICHVSRQAEVFYPSDTDMDFCGDMIVNTENEQLTALKVWPNPARDQLYFSGLELGDKLMVHNSQGAVVWQGEAVDQLTVSNWVAGIYHLMLLRKGEAIRSTKLAVID